MREAAFSALVAVIVGVVFSVPARAQAECLDLRCYSAHRAIAELARESAARESMGLGYAATLHILTSRDAPRARRDSVADGLEHLAMHSNDPELRTRATTILISAGRGAMDQPLSGASARVARILRATGDQDVRRRILHLGLWMADRQPLLPALREVAESQGVSEREMMFNHDADDPSLAVEALAQMGEDGAAILRDLHRRKALRSARASALLESLSRRGYRMGTP
jgi:hypothetical protein